MPACVYNRGPPKTTSPSGNDQMGTNPETVADYIAGPRSEPWQKTRDPAGGLGPPGLERQERGTPFRRTNQGPRSTRAEGRLPWTLPKPTLRGARKARPIHHPSPRPDLGPSWKGANRAAVNIVDTPRGPMPIFRAGEGSKPASLSDGRTGRRSLLAGRLAGPKGPACPADPSFVARQGRLRPWGP